MRSSLLDPQFRDDLAWWVKADRKTALRILTLVEDVMRDPFSGIGKPEPLKGLGGTWSRRVTSEHRLLYVVTDDTVDFISCRYHY